MTLVEYLGGELGLPGLHIAATNGPLRPNRKPVLQIMDADGLLIAFAKIGWDSSTREMVATEAAVLEELQERGFRDIVTPRVLHFGTWRDLAVLVTEPLVDLAELAFDDHLIDIALREIAQHRGTVRQPLSTSPWFEGLRIRSLKLNESDNLMSDAIAEVGRIHGGAEVAFGFGHGDWGPWNMARTGDTLGVWDWERAAPDVPLGLDLVHFHFQQEFHRNGNNVTDAIDAAHAATELGLVRLQIEPAEAHLLTLLYLVELALRYCESSLATDTGLDHTRQELLVAIHLCIGDRESRDPRQGQQVVPEGNRASFTRRTLGGAGVPASIREPVKLTVKRWGRATANLRMLPNTFIVGGQRCGTTSLFRYLTQHPSVTGPMLEKGVHYFDTQYDEELDWYRSHFPTMRSARLSRQKNGCDLRVVDSAPYYLFHPMVAARIAEVAPDAKIIAVLRDPVTRALSHHNHEVKRGFELETFKRAIELEKERLDGEVDKMAAHRSYVSYAHQHFSYVARGHYEKQLQRYDILFGAENVMVIRAVDLESNTAATVGRVLSFLDIPVLGTIKFPRFNSRSYPSMDPDIESQLRETFTPTDAAMANRFEKDVPWT